MTWFAIAFTVVVVLLVFSAVLVFAMQRRLVVALREEIEAKDKLIAATEDLLRATKDLSELRFETIERVQLQAADEFVKVQAQLVQLQAVETNADVRDAWGKAGELVEKAFKRFAPEKWAEDLEEYEKAIERNAERASEDKS